MLLRCTSTTQTPDVKGPALDVKGPVSHTLACAKAVCMGHFPISSHTLGSELIPRAHAGTIWSAMLKQLLQQHSAHKAPHVWAGSWTIQAQVSKGTLDYGRGANKASVLSVSALACLM